MELDFDVMDVNTYFKNSHSFKCLEYSSSKVVKLAAGSNQIEDTKTIGEQDGIDSSACDSDEL